MVRIRAGGCTVQVVRVRVRIRVRPDVSHYRYVADLGSEVKSIDGVSHVHHGCRERPPKREPS